MDPNPSNYAIIRPMDNVETHDHILIREGTIIARVPKGDRAGGAETDFFDVRTGVQIKRIYPELQQIELGRGYVLSDFDAAAILKYRLNEANNQKIINIWEIRQRKLDSVVADSILDQLKLITILLQKFVETSDSADKEERLWLSQQILTLVRKFSGRELSELEEIVEWFSSRPKPK